VSASTCAAETGRAFSPSSVGLLPAYRYCIRRAATVAAIKACTAQTPAATLIKAPCLAHAQFARSVHTNLSKSHEQQQ